MNKYKKLAFAVVSTVMAGTLMFSLAACNPDQGGNGGNGGGGGNGGNTGNTGEIKDEYGVLNEDGSINYGAYDRSSAVTLNLAVGHNSLTTSTSYKDFGAEITMPDGTTYAEGQLKPAWKQMGEDLNITFRDNYEGKATNANLEYLLTTAEGSGHKYDSTDLFTSDLSVIVTQVAAGTSILNLADYLDCMPNFKTFLKENPIVYLSLLQAGMNTSNGQGQELYVAPYFDGNDDIERYCIMRHDLVEKLLNGTTAFAGATTTFTATHVQPYFTEGYEIDSLNAAGNAHQTIKKDYAAALTAVKDTGSDLGKAYNAIAGKAYDGTTGNIVEIMNKAIAANSANATGTNLVALYRAYIDAAYKVGNNAAYTADHRANLFIGYDAAWDVDDLVALLRCVKANSTVLAASGNTLYGIAPRRGDMDRTPDMVSLAAQLYGARGATSKFENTYIDANGTLQDARNDKAFYEALGNMHALYEEGLIADFSNTSFKGDTGVQGTNEYFMMYDYSQTQTLNGFYVEDTLLSGAPSIPNGYYFSPVLTPVAKWSVNGANDTIMRFTESWRSTKTGGLALNGALANNPEKLKAALQFVDYLYSEDGQIVSTYGPMAQNAQGNGGFWYNEVAGASDTNTFMYKGVKYKGTAYKDRFTPTLTDNMIKSFKGEKVNGWAVGDNEKASNAKLNYTNYARELIGSTLPVGVKDQSFENQLTSKMGQAGANMVGVALKEGVVKGTTLAMDSNNWWYTTVPTGLPVEDLDQSQALDNTNQDNLKKLSGQRFSGQDKNMYSIFSWVILYGFDSHSYGYQATSPSYSSIDQLLALMSGTDVNDDKGAQYREAVFQDAWDTAKAYWEFLKG